MSFIWCCPSCGTEVELRKRVTVTKRKCSVCGEQITVGEIDRQQGERARIRAELDARAASVQFTILVVLVCSVAGGAALLGLFGGGKTSGPAAPALQPESSAKRQFTPSDTSEGALPDKPSAESTAAIDEAPPKVRHGVRADTEDNNSAFSAALNKSIEPSSEVLQNVDDVLRLAEEGSFERIQQRIDAMSSEVVSEYHDSLDADKFNKEGLVALKKKSYGSAAECFAKALEIDRSDAKFLSNLAFSQMCGASLEPAQRNSYCSIGLNPKRTIAWKNLGQVFAKQHRQNKAIACFLVAFTLEEEKSIVYLKSLDKDENVAIRLAGAAALERIRVLQGSETQSN